MRRVLRRIDLFGRGVRKCLRRNVPARLRDAHPIRVAAVWTTRCRSTYSVLVRSRRTRVVSTARRSSATRDYSSGTNVMLTATPMPGRFFVGWSGDCSGTNPMVTVAMNGDRACTAEFRNPQGDIEVVQVAPSGAPFVAGTIGSFVVTIRNNGPEAVSSVNLRVTSPDGFTPDSASSDPACGFPQNNQCPLTGDLAPGATPRRPRWDSTSIRSSAACRPLRCGRAVRSSIPTSANNEASGAGNVIGVADLGITASVTPDPSPAGELATVLATVVNNGPSSATNIAIDRVLPADISFVDRDGIPVAGQPGSCTVSESCSRRGEPGANRRAGWRVIVQWRAANRRSQRIGGRE